MGHKLGCWSPLDTLISPQRHGRVRRKAFQEWSAVCMSLLGMGARPSTLVGFLWLGSGQSLASSLEQAAQGGSLPSGVPLLPKWGCDHTESPKTHPQWCQSGMSPANAKDRIGMGMEDRHMDMEDGHIDMEDKHTEYRG